ncbi:hypothetical protein, partial [Vibrio cyclitrophicus]|uniref:hypothetical protein n=1 Tax=Vibrio cyclitrophicus TaxID=47951 RepID=UPI001A7E0804
DKPLREVENMGDPFFYFLPKQRQWPTDTLHCFITELKAVSKLRMPFFLVHRGLAGTKNKNGSK